MSSLSFWTSFFKEAGIPVSTARSYATSFEDNRMTTDMLLDLDKEVLRELGIKMMGDIIAILKHAKSVHSEEVRKKERASSSAASTEKSAVKVAPLTSQSANTPRTAPTQRAAATATPRATVSSHKSEVSSGHVPIPVVVQRPDPVIDPIHTQSTLTQQPDDDLRHAMSGGASDLRHTISGADGLRHTMGGADDLRHTMTGGVQHIKKASPVIIRTIPEVTPTGTYSSLHSDQEVLPREPVSARILPSTRSLESPSNNPKYVHEEYTTATYEARLKTKAKNTRTVVLPPSLHRASDDPVERSKRMLGAAGLIGVEEKRPPPVEQKSSVFSRLGVTKPEISSPTPQARGIKSRLGGRLGQVDDKEEGDDGDVMSTTTATVPDHAISVHSRLGPRKNSNVADNSVVVKKMRLGSSTVLVRPTMVADELENSTQTGVHERLQQHGGGLGQAKGKRSVVFKRLF